MSVAEYDFLFKAIVCGDGGVGKTALTIRFTKGLFQQDYKLTIGVDFHIKTIEIQTDEGIKRCKLQLWDTGGQERFSSVRPMYYRGALGALLVFDLTSYESFGHLPNWIEEIKSNSKSDIPMLLIGNKSDLINDRMVNNSDVEEFTKKFNLYYLETSAKSGEKVSDCFAVLAYLMMGYEVPQELLGKKELIKPGMTIPQTKYAPEPEFVAPPVPEPAPEPEPEFIAPPVPEPAPEPEPEFIAPPVLEPAPEPESEFIAPPVPEPTPVPEPEIKPTQEISKFDSSPATPEAINFTPKSVPFSPKAPKPVPPPEDFKPISPAPKFKSKKSKETVPFKTDKTIPPIPKSTKSFISEQVVPMSESTQAKNIEVDSEPVLFSESKSETSASLTQYLPESSSQEGTFFQTLSEARKKKGDLDKKPESMDSFIPFIPKKTEATPSTLEESLKTIPSAEEIKKKQKKKTKVKDKQKKTEKENEKEIKKDVVICKNCGSILSRQYLFCNRCGAKL